jgi:hypothetical protein
MYATTDMLLDKGGQPTATTQETPEEPLGLLERKPSIASKDFATLAISLTCFALAVASVTIPRLAVSLGETKQLIVVGFLLAIMALCTEAQVRQFSFLIEAHWGKSTLQNFEALLVNEPWSRNISLMPQTILMLLFALPLGLSASYKNYIGGFTSLTTDSQD